MLWTEKNPRAPQTYTYYICRYNSEDFKYDSVNYLQTLKNINLLSDITYLPTSSSIFPSTFIQELTYGNIIKQFLFIQDRSDNSMLKYTCL